MSEPATHRRNARRPFADHVEGFGHAQLAALPSYRAFREVLADLIDESDAPLGRLLGDIRNAALSSVFGAPCDGCGLTSRPSRGNRRGTHFVGVYDCACGRSFRAVHDLSVVDWPNGGEAA